MIEQGKKYEIELKHILYYVLRKWRWVISFSLIFACLLGMGMSAKSLLFKNDADSTQINDEINEYNRMKSTYEQEINSLTKKIESMGEYLDKSFFMKVNPYDKHTATFDIYINTDYKIIPEMYYQNADCTDSIIKAYYSALQNEDIYEEIKEVYPVTFEERKYLMELIKVSPDYDTNTVRIEMIVPESAESNKLISILSNVVERYERDFNTSIGQHSASIINHDISITIDNDLEKKQENYYTNLANSQNALEEAQKSLKDLKEPINNNPSIKSILKRAVIYGVVGFILGMCLMAFLLCAQICVGNRVYTGAEVSKIFRRVYYLKGSNNSLFSFIDNFLEKNISVIPSINKNVAIQSIANEINNNSFCNKIVLISSLGDCPYLREVQELLEKSLANDKEVIIGGNILENQNLIKEVNTVSTFVVVEKRSKSFITDINESLSIMAEANKKDSGMILF